MDKNVAETLKAIANKLDVPVEALWNGLLAYAQFYGYAWAIFLLLSVLGASTLIWLCIRTVRTKELFLRGNPTGSCVLAFLLGGAAFVCIVSFMVNLSDTADGLAALKAPEAWASKYVLRRLGR